LTKLSDLITEAKKLAEIGGDWDRRNRLKVYEALSMLISREFKKSAQLFVDGIATFSCTELCSYDQFIFYAVAVCLISLPRTELFKKLINNPQIIAVIRSQPELQIFMQSLYKCDYKTFYASLRFIFASVMDDRYLASHVRYLMKEYRILAYSQFLESYKSVLMTSMAEAFDISLSLLDDELSHFISVGRLSAKIDKVGGIVVSSRVDTKNSQYQDTIKKGDALLNQIQKLVRVIDV
jgi:26S proteasome regulatory subunit N7